MFLLDSEDRILLVADTLVSRLDADPERLTGRPITALVAEADVSQLQSALCALRTTPGRAVERIDCRLRTDADAAPVEIELSMTDGQDEPGDILGAVRSANTLFSDQQAWFGHFFDRMDEAVVEFELVDGEPIVRDVNPAFEEMFGYHAGYVTGESLNNYIVPTVEQREAASFDHRIADGEVIKRVVTRETASGTRDFFCRCLPAGDDDRQRGLAIYSDITAAQQSRQHLEVLHRVLRHNLRNELTVILGMAEEIGEYTNSAQVEQAMSRITNCAEKLEGVSEKARIAQAILDQPPSDSVVDVGRILGSVVSDARVEWPDATITTNIESSLPVGTGSEIRDALENIVENALKHNNDHRSMRVTAERRTPVHVSTRGSRQSVIITIADDGPGIPEQERAVVFDEEDITQLKHGTGLGLWVVRWVTEAAGGKVTYDRTDGWTTIQLQLPLAPEIASVSTGEDA